MMGIKNKLMEVQARVKRDKERVRENLVNRVEYGGEVRNIFSTS